MMQSHRESGIKIGRGNRVRGCKQAFTLLELMMVVAIIGLVMAMGIPSFLSIWHQGPMRRAVNDVLQICTRARDEAILQGKTTEVVFHPQIGQVAFNGSSTPGETPPTMPGTKPVNSMQFDNSVTIEMLDINLREFKDSEEARVRFFPNGTSDEMTLILFAGGERREIRTELTTGITSVGNVLQ